MTRTEVSPRKSPRPTSRSSGGITRYFQDSQKPLASLTLLVPFIVLYELGTQLYTSDPNRHREVRIIAFNLLQDFFHFFGASGRYLPAMAVVGILLSWHIAHNDPWRVRFNTIVGMLAESVILGFPVIFLSYLSSHHVPLMATGGGWQGLLVLSVGAGIYEELVFRLIAFSVLHLVLVDCLKVGRLVSNLLIVFIPAILFSCYHYLGNEHFALQSFVFRTLAGIYFGLLFLFRGFGITACAHAAYDVLIVLLATLS